LDPKDVDSRLDFARAHIMSGDKKLAYKELHLLTKQCKNSSDVLKRIDQISEEPISIAGKACAAELSKTGIDAYRKRNFDQSIEIFTEALKMFPNHIGVNLNLVQVILAKYEKDGKNKDSYSICKNCFKRIGGLHAEHKQYARHKFLQEQFSREYKDYK
jgi:tetratricopeptide (TPR) repeat protein